MNSINDDDEENDDQQIQAESILLSTELDMESFSDSNLILINKLEYIENTLKEMYKQMNQGHWDTNYGNKIYKILKDNNRNNKGWYFN